MGNTKREVALMTVRELYLALESMPENAPVIIMSEDGYVELSSCKYESPQGSGDYTFGSVQVK